MSRLPAILVAPVAAGQGRRLQHDTPRLPEAHGPRDGLLGAMGRGSAKPLRLLVVGDSTAVGTGVATLEHGIPVQLGRLLSSRSPEERGVAWRAVGRNGATAREVLDEFGAAAVAAHFDLAVVMVGWNDAIRMQPAGSFARALDALLDRLHAGSPHARLLVVAPPRFDRFASLPQPLRWALGRHALGLTRRAERVARRHAAVFAAGFDGSSVASDGFHPDAVGYQTLAEGIAERLSGPSRARAPRTLAVD